MTEDTFHKILSNTASEAEKSDFFISLEQDPGKNLHFQHYKNLCVLSSMNPERYRDRQDKSFKKFWERTQSQRPQLLIHQWMRYAAIFIVALSLGFMADFLLNRETISTTLVEGCIDLIRNSGDPFLPVKHGELVSYNKTNKNIVVKQKDPSIVIAWTEKKFVFIDQPLSEIYKELENWYNSEIQITDPKRANTRYTSVIKRSTTV